MSLFSSQRPLQHLAVPTPGLMPSWLHNPLTMLLFCPGKKKKEKQKSSPAPLLPAWPQQPIHPIGHMLQLSLSGSSPTIKKPCLSWWQLVVTAHKSHAKATPGCIPRWHCDASKTKPLSTKFTNCCHERERNRKKILHTICATTYTFASSIP